MNLVTCPGCRESFAVEQQFAVVSNASGESQLVWTQHYLAADGRVFCCLECFDLNA